MTSMSEEKRRSYASWRKGRRDFADGVGRGEAAVTGFLTQEAHNLCAVLVENKHTDGKAEVLEVLTDAEEVCGEVVVEKEVLDFLFYGIGGDARIIPQPCAIADPRR